ncbi:metalloregulator ArsR/SmtB family transcription factor [Amycolatopsis acidiphila]|uniref:Helix-turn-helix transcriptional regulator n=1 Tax=Amycolatopsis acidiphila TaxID=715473 RepID=A0A558A4M5_9PSEU|nr:metalloregulator ArsR/SmtB family transcription factor [Amycolatopsis acidiphila]TVT19207.1 helix-turn-helix transcriptional regulator [Amycolatopsis acidiphila]UIJ62027.1 metalloregulator ArsR/SmtB family transcription factor [Amycolatopsis acidiphila]
MSLDTDALRVLADPLRAQILELLAGEALCTCHLVEATGAKQTNISNHLRQLRDAGLVQTEPCGRYTYYRLRADAVQDAADSLAALAARARLNPTSRRPC